MNERTASGNLVSSDLVERPSEPEIDLEVSVVMVADGRGTGLAELVDRCLSALDMRGGRYEFLLVYNAASEDMRAAVRALADRNVTGIPLRPWHGLDAAAATGIGRAAGDVVLTVPSWPEVDPQSFGALIDALDGEDTYLATGLRTSQGRSRKLGMRAAVLDIILWRLFQTRFKDVFCRTRAGRREVFQEIVSLGVRQHFLPLVAVSHGYGVREVSVRPAVETVAPNLHSLRLSSHLKALADIVALYIALKFLRRPLRFFGAIGLPLIVLGAAFAAYLAISRLLFGTPLADRPALVLSVIVLVLGVQITALGLVGEIIVFASSRLMRRERTKSVVGGGAEPSRDDGAFDCSRP